MEIYDFMLDRYHDRLEQQNDHDTDADNFRPDPDQDMRHTLHGCRVILEQIEANFQRSAKETK